MQSHATAIMTRNGSRTTSMCGDCRTFHASGGHAALARLYAVTELRDLTNPPGNRFEALRGDRAGQYSIRINDKWRICFEWSQTARKAYNIEIVDYH